jgi:hypothetical protein
MDPYLRHPYTEGRNRNRNMANHAAAAMPDSRTQDTSHTLENAGRDPDRTDQSTQGGQQQAQQVAISANVNQQVVPFEQVPSSEQSFVWQGATRQPDSVAGNSDASQMVRVGHFDDS